jgi:hypothetical protein
MDYGKMRKKITKMSRYKMRRFDNPKDIYPYF